MFIAHIHYEARIVSGVCVILWFQPQKASSAGWSCSEGLVMCVRDERFTDARTNVCLHLGDVS